jgi:hypothetical protein
MEMKKLCQKCFSTHGYSMELEEKEDGVYVCPRDPGHRYKREDDGSFIPL